jgi:hypothetical protein
VDGSASGAAKVPDVNLIAVPYVNHDRVWFSQLFVE